MAAKYSTPETRDWSDLILEIDWDKVSEAINSVEENQPAMPDYERQDVRKLVLVAAERWLPRDLVEWTDVTVEEPFQTPQIRGILDLRGRHRGLYKEFADFAGAAFIGDWKTTRGALDADWAERYKFSWQWKQYVMAYPETKLFTYRGISRNGETREVIIQVPELASEEARMYLSQVRDMRRVLQSTQPWPRKMPGSCHAYGRDCDFIENCHANIVPEGLIDIDKPMSYSSTETFLLCPEKHRLTQLAGYGEDDETLAFGKAFHRGIAEVYSQAFNIETQTTKGNIECS